VWPETYEQTRSLWESGKIVLVNVRVRARDDRLSAGVQKVALYGEGELDVQGLFVEPRPSYGNADRGWRRGGGNGNRKMENEKRGPEESGRTKIEDEGLSASPGQQGLAQAGMSTVTLAPPREEAIRITLEETEDADEDHERLRALVNALREFDGEGSVRLAIRQRDGEEVEMELPSARYCPELTQLLGEIIGPWGTVRA
jgi:hypothetical protein